MTRKFWFASSVCAMALALACSKQSPQPTSPSATAAVADTGAGGEGALKANAPTPVSPINGVKVAQGDSIVLTVNNSTATYATNVPLRYEFALINAAGQQIFVNQTAAGSGQTSMPVSASLEAEQTYQWHARAFYGDATGPWSAFASFVAPQNEGYIRGNELYDPLMNGKTVGATHGPVTFIPNVGIRLDDLTSYVSYELPQTLDQGSMSMLVTNMPANTKGGKTKVFAMGQGYDDIITNEYRMTVEKRGDPPGIIAWRFIARDDQIDTEGAEREFYNFLASETYFFEASWFNNRFNLVIREGGVNGRTVYDHGKNWDGRGYVPNPHVIYVGAPVGRSGPDGASVQGMVVRQLWVSGRPRPGFANQ